MALGNKALKAELDEFKAVVFQSSARKQYGPAIAAMFDGEADHTPGEWGAVTNVDGVFSVEVVNWPGESAVVLTALAHPEVTPLQLPFTPGLGPDLDALDFEFIEEWVEEARTGVKKDNARNFKRAAQLAELVRR